jgi:hypothetical protein
MCISWKFKKKKKKKKLGIGKEILPSVMETKVPHVSGFVQKHELVPTTLEPNATILNVNINENDIINNLISLSNVWI